MASYSLVWNLEKQVLGLAFSGEVWLEHFSTLQGISIHINFICNVTGLCMKFMWNRYDFVPFSCEVRMKYIWRSYEIQMSFACFSCNVYMNFGCSRWKYAKCSHVIRMKFMWCMLFRYLVRFDIWLVNKSDVKRRNTLGCLDQCMAQHHVSWNSHTAKQAWRFWI